MEEVNKEKKEILKCERCGKRLKKDDDKCPECGYKNNSSKSLYIFIGIVVSIIFLIIIGVQNSNKSAEYKKAVEYFENKDYDNAYVIFNKLNNYELTKEYLTAINYLREIDNGNPENVLADIDNQPNNIKVMELIKKYATNAYDYKNSNYERIWIDNRYNEFFINDKEKEIVNEGMYQYGMTTYNEGYYGKAHLVFKRLGDYKDCKTILQDKYFGLIGNGYMYGTRSGYVIGMLSFFFHSSSDKVIYNVFTESVYSTYIPDGYEYDYRIKNNQLILGDNIVYDIISFDGNNLVVRSSSNGRSYTLEKS